MKDFLILVSLLSFNSIWAQPDSLTYSWQPHEIQLDSTDNNVIAETTAPGVVKYIYTNEIDSLIEFQKNAHVNNCPKTVRGFKVQIYSCSGINCQEKADKNYNQFLIAFPEISAEKIWDPPSYKVRVGNCRNRFQAEQIKSKIKEDFPFIFIVPDFINSPYKVDCKSIE